MILLRKVKSPQSAVVLMVQYRRDKCWQEAGVWGGVGQTLCMWWHRGFTVADALTRSSVSSLRMGQGVCPFLHLDKKKVLMGELCLGRGTRRQKPGNSSIFRRSGHLGLYRNDFHG